MKSVLPKGDSFHIVEKEEGLLPKNSSKKRLWVSKWRKKFILTKKPKMSQFFLEINPVLSIKVFKKRFNWKFRSSKTPNYTLKLLKSRLWKPVLLNKPKSKINFLSKIEPIRCKRTRILQKICKKNNSLKKISCRNL